PGATGWHHVGRRTADAGHRARPDGRAASADPGRTFAGPLAADGRGTVRPDPAAACGRAGDPARGAERGPVAGDGATGLRTGERGGALQRRLPGTDGQRRCAPGLSRDVAMAEPQTLAQKLIAAACGRDAVAEGE